MSTPPLFRVTDALRELIEEDIYTALRAVNVASRHSIKLAGTYPEISIAVIYDDPDELLITDEGRSLSVTIASNTVPIYEREDAAWIKENVPENTTTAIMDVYVKPYDLVDEPTRLLLCTFSVLRSQTIHRISELLTSELDATTLPLDKLVFEVPELGIYRTVTVEETRRFLTQRMKYILGLLDIKDTKL